MTLGEMPPGGVGTSESVSSLLQNRDLFDEFNRLRYRNVCHTFPENYSLIFKMVPFLLHTNFRGLPGFVAHPETPCGIAYYVPDEPTAHLVNGYFSKKCKFKERENLNEGFIEFLSVMGSVGSVAQTTRSDFDIWVGIHRDSVDQEGYRRFLEKLRGIEEWLERLRLEVHFFPTDIKSVSNNVFGSVDSESCGSAQALMLKDEFYRTAILISGKIPYWWMTAPGISDEEYAQRYKRHLETEGSAMGQFVDIGNISRIEKGEFFGAALWQLVKSLQSPFKSFIKMCLIEKYLFSDPGDRVTLLSNTLKENVILNRNLDAQAIDGYLLMFKTVEDYFLKSDKMKEVDMLRACFYMKVQPNLSSLNKYAHAGSEKRQLIGRYVQEWKWDSDRLKHLDTFYGWSMEDLLKFDHELKVYMIQSFQALTKSRDLVGDNQLITEDDLKIISRKLLSHYLPKPKKVKQFCFSFDDSVYEMELSVARQDNTWQLYRGEMQKEQHKIKFTNMLYGSPNLTDLCLWTAYCKIFNPHNTKLSVFSAGSNVGQQDLSKLIVALSEYLGLHSSAKSRHYLEDPFIQSAFVTCGVDPDNAADKISIFYLNSWKELFAEHFASEEDADPLLGEILSGYVRLGMPNPLGFAMFHSAAGGMKDLLGFKKQVVDILSAFKSAHEPKKSVTVYLGARNGNYFCFAASGVRVQYYKQADLYVLMETVLREIREPLPKKYVLDASLDQNEFVQVTQRLKTD